MTTTSAFTFVHNAIDSGYPIVEAIGAVHPYVDEVVVADCQSTDDTWKLLEKLSETCLENGPVIDGVKSCNCPPIKIIGGYWGTKAGETLKQAHRLYKKCSGDIIIHFEADEVYDDSLIQRIVSCIQAGYEDIAVFRLQLEQNFQRCRWYPEPVHRVFPRKSDTHKEGHTTNRHEQAFQLMPKNGYLWDITNCFRDNWFERVKKQAQLRQSEPQYLLTPLHILHKSEFSETAAQQLVKYGRHWIYTNTPFNIPEILKPLVGVTKYEPKI